MDNAIQKVKKEKQSLFYKFINGIEVVGNKLPHPFYLFCLLIILAFVLSIIFSGASTTIEQAARDGGLPHIETVTIQSLWNRETIGYLLEQMPSIYYNFSPMMLIGTLILSLGLAERVGFFNALIKKTLGKASPTLVFAILSFIAINANIASNGGYLAMAAISASVFAAMGYNPWLGILLS